MIESQVFKEWTDLAKIEGLKEGKNEMLLRFLRQKGAVPADLEQAICDVADPAGLDALADAAASCASIDDFRRTTGL